MGGSCSRNGGCEESFNCKAGEHTSVGNCRLKPENIIKVVLVKECQGLWTGFIYFEVQVAGCCEHCHESSVSLKCRKCLNQL